MSKGSKQRPYNKAKFDENFDRIFKKDNNPSDVDNSQRRGAFRWTKEFLISVGSPEPMFNKLQFTCIRKDYDCMSDSYTYCGTSPHFDVLSVEGESAPLYVILKINDELSVTRAAK